MRQTLLAMVTIGFPITVESQGSIAGRVLSDSTRAPIAAADLIISGSTARAVTDSDGRFVLRDVPGGRRFLVIRALGFRPDTSQVELFDESVSREVFLKRRITTLGEVSVRDSSPVFVSAKLREFNERRRAPVGGHFIDSTVIAKWESRKTGDLLSTIPGVDLKRGGSAAYVTGSRAPPSLARGAVSRPVPCFMDVYVDGALVYTNSMQMPLFDINSIGPNHIAAIEVYSGPANTPAQYNRTSKGCGVVLIWTR